MGFSFQEATCIGKSSSAHAPGLSTKVIVVYTRGLLEKLRTSCDGGFAAALVKELTRCVERNRNPWNAVPAGIIHHCGTDGPAEGLPQTPALSGYI